MSTELTERLPAVCRLLSVFHGGAVACVEISVGQRAATVCEAVHTSADFWKTPVQRWSVTNRGSQRSSIRDLHRSPLDLQQFTLLPGPQKLVDRLAR